MKFKLNDIVLVTAGKDKGKSGPIVLVNTKKNKVVVQGANKYVKHTKPGTGRAGGKALIERALPVANIAILNENNQPDRIGYLVAKDGSRTRVFKKTGSTIAEHKSDKK